MPVMRGADSGRVAVFECLRPLDVPCNPMQTVVDAEKH